MTDETATPSKQRRKAGRPPRLPIQETVEFKEAVASAVAAATLQAMEQMRTELALAVSGRAVPGGPGGSSTEKGLMSELALAIAEISDQGTSRKRVAPEVLAQRAEAHRRACDLITKVRAEGLKPEYALVAKVYLNERFIEPFRVDRATKQPVRQEIIWSGMPNHAMRPMNDIAKAIYSEWSASVGSVEQVPNADNRPVWVTASGLVVKGDAPGQRRDVSADVPALDDLGIKGQDDPTAPFVAVLGTVAPPAKQNVLPNGGAPGMR